MGPALAALTASRDNGLLDAAGAAPPRWNALGSTGQLGPWPCHGFTESRQPTPNAKDNFSYKAHHSTATVKLPPQTCLTRLSHRRHYATRGDPARVMQRPTVPAEPP